MRSVIKDALERLSNCKTDENDVNHMLTKSFDNKTFKDIMKCTQGDLEACKHVNLAKWATKTKIAVDEICKKGALKAEQKKEEPKEEPKKEPEDPVKDKERKED